MTEELCNQFLYIKTFLGLVEMTFGLVHASYRLPEWQAVKLTFFAPCKQLAEQITNSKDLIYTCIAAVLRDVAMIVLYSTQLYLRDFATSFTVQKLTSESST